MQGQVKSFGFGIVGKLFLWGVTAFWLTVFNLSDADTLFLRVGWWVGVLLFGWGTALTFATKITINDASIHLEAAHLLPSRKMVWTEIGYVKSDSIGGTGDAPSIDAYWLIPKDRRSRKRVLIGPWIASYKQLLREVLERVPPDTKIDADVFETN